MHLESLEIRPSRNKGFSVTHHFKPRPQAYTPPNTAEVDRARTELEKLFGKR